MLQQRDDIKRHFVHRTIRLAVHIMILFPPPSHIAPPLRFSQVLTAELMLYYLKSPTKRAAIAAIVIPQQSGKYGGESTATGSKGVTHGIV